jgi:uncharacterized SAM-binding protein YcdF (DUF218 family)
VNGARLVAVLGYSRGRTGEIHAVCAARVARAIEEASPGDAVLVSGWGRRRSASEAELMAEVWNGHVPQVLLDRNARTTYGNAVGVAATARTLGHREVVVVTSRWHGRRASALVRAALRGTGHAVTLAATDERGTVVARLRELACWPLVPFQIALAGRRR